MLPNLPDRLFHKGIHAPVSGTATYISDKIKQHLLAVDSVQHFRMKLDRIQISRHILCRRNRTVLRMGNDLKPRSGLTDIIKMTHPAYC